MKNERIIEILAETYPMAKADLIAKNPFEMLIATMLSAQTTDVQVNKVTKELFKKYKSPKDIAYLDVDEFSLSIKSCGFYKTKGKNIIKTCNILVDKYDGKVPGNFDDLVKLPGVGRKTANVVLSNSFNVDAIAVDTHVFRVSNRLGLANSKDVVETEEQLKKNIKKELWSKSHHYLIYHGRRICKARKPLCDECPLIELCDYKNKTE